MRLHVIFGMTVALMPLYLPSVLNAMTKEEVTVRAAYASVVLASRVHSVLESDGESDTARLAISLKDVRQGAVSELLDRLIRDQVTVPSGDVLPCIPGTWSFRSTPLATQHTGTTVTVGAWAPATNVYGEAAKHLPEGGMTFLQVFQILGWQPESWASFTVSLSAHGRKREYKAMFLFEPAAADASDQVRVVDYVLGVSLFSTLLRAPVADDVSALPARTRGSGPVRLLESVRAVEGCIMDTVTGLCCDSATLQCGVKPKSNPMERQ